jgi:hypothetical protein
MEIMNKPIFILGAPRSGTTFLASLLKRTDYGAPFETHFITKYYKKLDNYGDINSYKNFQKLLADILSERAVQQWRLKFSHEEFFRELGSSFTYSQLVNELCLKASKQKGFAFWGDKTPHYLADMEILYKLFPDSKYLYIVRDGRDVTLSLLEKDWGPNNVYYSARHWVNLNQNHKSLEYLRASKNLYELRYEDLLDNVEEYIKDIYTFLNMDYSENDLRELAVTVKPGNYNKWKNRMTARQIDTFDKIASNTLKRFNYEISAEEGEVSLIWKVVYFSHNLIFRVRHLFIINVIDGIKIKFFGKEPFAE